MSIGVMLFQLLMGSVVVVVAPIKLLAGHGMRLVRLFA